MTIEQKLFLKLEPHAKRIKDGEGNDFDYLPAVLLRLMEEQTHQINLLGDTAKFLDSIQNTINAIGGQSKAQITAFEAAAQRKMEQLENVIEDTQTQLKNTQSAISEQISVLTSSHAAHVLETDECLSAISLKIESVSSSTQKTEARFMRLLIAGLVAFIVMIGLAVAILQRH